MATVLHTVPDQAYILLSNTNETQQVFNIAVGSTLENSDHILRIGSNGSFELREQNWEIKHSSFTENADISIRSSDDVRIFVGEYSNAGTPIFEVHNNGLKFSVEENKINIGKYPEPYISVGSNYMAINYTSHHLQILSGGELVANFDFRDIDFSTRKMNIRTNDFNVAYSNSDGSGYNEMIRFTSSLEIKLYPFVSMGSGGFCKGTLEVEDLLNIKVEKPGETRPSAIGLESSGTNASNKYWIWVDTSGKLRIKPNYPPTFAGENTEGVIVGTQS